MIPITHSYLSPKCETRQESKIHRYGVFAKQSIQKSELIAVWGGYIVTAEALVALPKEIIETDYQLQIYPGIYLSPKTVDDLGDADMVNHSCDANAGIKGQNILVARRTIQAGEEICFDYETTDTQGLNFVCMCHTPKCRVLINGEAWKNK
jgi:SET domain-containing protein